MKPHLLFTAAATVFLAEWFAPLISSAQDQFREPQRATTVYRQILPDGSVLYSDQMQPGARLDETIRIPLPAVETSGSGADENSETASGRSPEGSEDPKYSPQADSSLPRGEAQARVERAQAALEQARKRQQQGVEPLPGERTGTVFNRSRLNEAYEERQRALAQAVAEAEAALQQAIAQREELMNVR